MAVCARCGQNNPKTASFCQACGASLELPSPAREVRKTVTVVFTDVTGSTELGERLDPETLRRVMSRYFEEMKAVLERHGGSVEKFIGDAVMAVFGVPTLHEDDALRAVRAATDMRQVLADLNQDLERDQGITIATRTGVNTGEVVTSGGERERMVTGDAVNVAARLEQAAQPGETLIGESTWRLVRDATRTEPVPPVSAKGKTEPVPAHRLLEVIAGTDGVGPRLQSPMVGRERHLAQLRQAFEAAVLDRACHLFTVLGVAGVGKSRLVHEFLSGLPPEARVLRGRCLPYGEGITFWPIREIFKQAAGIVDDDPPERALERLAQMSFDDVVTERVAQVLGLSDASGSAEEIHSSVRKALETLARDRSLVVVIDDIQWAEATLLDLIEHVVDVSREAPIMLVCIARPEVLEERPGWGGGKHNAVSALLEPLTGQESEALIDNLLGRARLDERARARIAEAAEGNPLFVEEMLSMMIDDGLLARDNGHWLPTADLSAVRVPPTIQAVLAARLDRLEGEERAVIERAAVVGKVFYREAVVELCPEDLRDGISGHLTTLVRKELIRPDRSILGEEEAYRFRHILIRDAAYEAMPKETRAQLHEGFAEWLERTSGDRMPEFEEITGYHLEQAYRYRAELGPVDERAASLSERAGQRLAAAGSRAYARSDMPATSSLLARAVELLPKDSPERLEALLGLGVARGYYLGQFDAAGEALDEAEREAQRMGNSAVEWGVRIERARIAIVSEPRGAIEARRVAEEAIPALTELGDHLGLARAWFLLVVHHWLPGRAGDMLEAATNAVEHARRARDPQELWLSLGIMTRALLIGPTPAEEGIRMLAEIHETADSLWVQGNVLLGRARFEAMLGRSDEAAGNAARGRSILDDLGPSLLGVSQIAFGLAEIHRMSGHLEEQERALREGYDWLAQRGEQSFLSSMAPRLGLVCCELGRYDEAEELSRIGEKAAAADDLDAQISWRRCRALVLAQRGESEEAERMAREAVGLAEGTEFLLLRAETWTDLGEILLLAGSKDEAATAFEQAIDLHQRKQCLALADRARERLAAIPTRK